MSDGPGQEGRIDLSAYFDRIGYGGPATPTQAVLAALQKLHPATIAFEGVDVFLGRPVDISAAAVERKLIGRKRGGYCFEQNGLFRRVLLALGFDVTSLIGRVMWRDAPDAPLRPRTHMALKVRIRGDDWLADVGFGGSTLTAPLLWMYDTSQRTPHASYRLVRYGGDTALEQETEEDGAKIWRRAYSMSPDPQIEADYEPANWFTSTHPDSWFRHNLVCALSPEGRRLNLFNNRLTVRPSNAEPEQHILDAEGLERCLVEDFGLPVEPDWRPALQRAVEIGTGAP
jgi:N-hydroxyarylamine O-acetyltransferase